MLVEKDFSFYFKAIEEKQGRIYVARILQRVVVVVVVRGGGGGGVTPCHTLGTNIVHCRCSVQKMEYVTYLALEKIYGMLILRIRAFSPSEL